MRIWETVMEKQRLKEANGKLMQELYKCDQSDYDRLRGIFESLKHANVNRYELECLKQDVIGMVLEGIERGEKFEDILGGDAGEFKEKLLRTCREKSLMEHTCHFAEHILLITLVLYWTEWFLSGRSMGSVEITGRFTAFVLIWAVVMVFNRLRFTTNALKGMWSKVIFWIMLLSVVFLHVVLQNYFDTAHYRVLFTVMWWQPTAVLTALIAVFHYLGMRAEGWQTKVK